jgi:hypothetical protein
MTAAQLATSRRFVEALGARDPDAAHPDIELRMARGVLRGHDRLFELLAGTPLEHLERTILIDDVLDAGERALALGPHGPALARDPSARRHPQTEASCWGRARLSRSHATN